MDFGETRLTHNYYNNQHRSEGFVLTGYDIPGCSEDGAWMLWENSSVAAAVVVIAHPGLGRGQLWVLFRLRRFRDIRIDPSRLPSTDGIRDTASCRRMNSNMKKNVEREQQKNTYTNIYIKK